MKNINSYKSRFYVLLESNLGDVKPIVSEQSSMAKQEEEAIYFAHDFEVLKAQKMNPKPGGIEYCDPCMLTKTGRLEGDVKGQEFCVNKSLYQEKKWVCPKGYGLYSTISKEYRIGDFSDESKRKVGGLIRLLPSYKYEDPLSDPHVLLSSLSFFTGFIPVVGPFLSIGIGLGNAALYWGEGKKEEAAIAAIFSLLPSFLKIVKKIPEIKTLGTTGMVRLADKVSKGERLIEMESKIVSKLTDKQIKAELQEEINNFVKNTASQNVTKPNVSQDLKNKLKEISTKGIEIKPNTNPNTNIITNKENIRRVIKTDKYNFEQIKKIFGSSGNYNDNKMLEKAWQKGWRPGKPIPNEYQTDLYKKNTSNNSLADSNL